ncbi:ImmA/IrrE family metallo-endopeptidase [Flindersiella endophytica]
MKGEKIDIIEEMRRLLPQRALDVQEAQLVAEYQALRLLELLGLTTPAVDVGIITELPQVSVKIRSKLAASGLAGRHDGRWVIAIREEDHLCRRRFTLARVFKMIIDDELHETLYQPSFSGSTIDVAETACDTFAANLLMPRAWVHEAWQHQSRSVGQLAALFCVSRVAMGRRLRDLGLVDQADRKPAGHATASVRGYFQPVGAKG